ncbi:BgTH12-04274 [Blumeria graminis f. sp. triticale]|uniref:Bgt-50991 n=2 Tax=Blumeria graminis TaxID=34373 RepID=A0A9X9PRV9_BLUGR|nr:BgTH12-04274 [Blumeria graminis f. sp. triticale]VCU40413.1 Bgt-50991 [Blumeria graminis f. sp. tritici]
MHPLQEQSKCQPELSSCIVFSVSCSLSAGLVPVTNKYLFIYSLVWATV